MKYIILLITFLFLSGCDTSPRCIDASDFGQPQGIAAVNGEDIEARFGSESEHSFFQKTWSTYTGFILTGADLVIRIQGAWSPWTDVLLEDDSNSCGRVQKVCTLSDDFEPFVNDDFAGYRFPQNTSSGCTNETQPNICWFPYGIGVYVGLASNPRVGLESLFHLANPDYYGQVGNSWKFTLPASELEVIKDAIGVNNFSSIRIYIRVHDNDYGDNINGCIDENDDGSAIMNPTDGQITACETPMDLFFESGARREDPGFLETAARVFMDPARGIIETSYKAYIESPTYKNIFYATSMLFVVFIAIGYFTAFIQLSIHAMWGLIFRFAIISSLLHPDGWGFFNQFVVTFFWNGSAELANVVLKAFEGAINNAEFVSSFSIGETIDASILQNVDDSLAMFVSYPVNSKIMALLFSHGLGWLLIVALYFSFYVYLFAMLKLTVIFIFIFVTLTILLSLAPVFILFALFKYTREAYFENWLKSLISVSIQPMMLFVFVGIFLSIINYFLMDMLYYKACWDTIFSLVFIDIEFWKVRDIYNYNDGSPTASDDLNISFIDIFMLFLSAMIIRYVTEQVPDVAERIGGGFSMRAVSQGVMQMGKVLEYAGEEMVKTTAKSTWKRTGGAALGAGVNKFAPKIVSKYAHKMSGGLINKTDTARMAKAQKAVRAELMSKGWKDKDIKAAMKSGKLKSKLNDQLAVEKAKDMRYGKKSLNPIKIMQGLKNEVMDNVKMSMQKAQLRASGKKMTKAAKRNLRRGMIKKELNKVGKNAKLKESIDKRTDAAFASKFGKEDLRDSIREVKSEANSGKRSIDTKDDLDKALMAKMKDKGYDESSAQKLIDSDRDAGEGGKMKDAVRDFATGSSSGRSSDSSRIKSEFGDLPEEGGDKSSAAKKPDPIVPDGTTDPGEPGGDGVSGGSGRGLDEDEREAIDQEFEDYQAESILEDEQEKNAEEEDEALGRNDDNDDGGEE